MLYWLIWLAVAIAFVALYALFILPRVFRRTKQMTSGKKGFLGKGVPWICFISINLVLTAGLLLIAIGVFLHRGFDRFAVGVKPSGAFVFYFLFALVAVVAVAMTVWLIALSVRTRRKKSGGGDKRRKAVSWATLIALCVAALVTAATLALLFDYVMLKLISVSKMKRALLLIVALECLGVLAVGFVLRRKKAVRFASIGVVVLLFLLVPAYYSLLAFCKASTVQWAVLVIGTTMFILIPLLVGVGFVFGKIFFRDAPKEDRREKKSKDPKKPRKRK